jgi:hypothetical protein
VYQEKPRQIEIGSVNCGFPPFRQTASARSENTLSVPLDLCSNQYIRGLSFVNCANFLIRVDEKNFGGAEVYCNSGGIDIRANTICSSRRSSGMSTGQIGSKDPSRQSQQSIHLLLTHSFIRIQLRVHFARDNEEFVYQVHRDGP